MRCFLKICLDIQGLGSKDLKLLYCVASFFYCFFLVNISVCKVFFYFCILTNSLGMFDFAQTSFLNSRGSGRSRLADRDAPPSNNSNSDRDRENFSRWRERQYFGPRRWLETALRESPYEKDAGLYFKQQNLNKCQ